MMNDERETQDACDARRRFWIEVLIKKSMFITPDRSFLFHLIRHSSFIILHSKRPVPAR